MEKVLNLILTELKSLNQRVGGLEQGQAKIENRIGNLEQGQAKIENRMDGLESKVNKLELRIENEVIEKIRAFYDFRESQMDVNNRILAALERIESKIESHDIQIHILNKTKANRRKAK